MAERFYTEDFALGEPSYDIYADYEGKRFLFKHVRESEVLGEM